MNDQPDSVCVGAGPFPEMPQFSSESLQITLGKAADTNRISPRQSKPLKQAVGADFRMPRQQWTKKERAPHWPGDQNPLRTFGTFAK